MVGAQANKATRESSGVDSAPWRRQSRKIGLSGHCEPLVSTQPIGPKGFAEAEGTKSRSGSRPGWAGTLEECNKPMAVEKSDLLMAVRELREDAASFRNACCRIDDGGGASGPLLLEAVFSFQGELGEHCRRGLS